MYFKNFFLVLIFFFTCSFLIAQEKSLTLKELCKEILIMDLFIMHIMQVVLQ
jgi:hypothetical protein